MKLRPRTWIALLGVAGVLLAVYFEPTYCVRGWLRGEAFYDGRPTSYWRTVVVDGLSIDWKTFPNFSLLDRIKLRLGVDMSEPSSLSLMRDHAADSVLRELADDTDVQVAGFVRDI